MYTMYFNHTHCVISQYVIMSCEYDVCNVCNICDICNDAMLAMYVIFQSAGTARVSF